MLFFLVQTTGRYLLASTMCLKKLLDQPWPFPMDSYLLFLEYSRHFFQPLTPMHIASQPTMVISFRHLHPHTLFTRSVTATHPNIHSFQTSHIMSLSSSYQHTWDILIMTTVMTEKLWEKLASYQATFSCVLFMHSWHLRLNPEGKDSL